MEQREFGGNKRTVEEWEEEIECWEKRTEESVTGGKGLENQTVVHPDWDDEYEDVQGNS